MGRFLGIGGLDERGRFYYSYLFVFALFQIFYWVIVGLTVDWTPNVACHMNFWFREVRPVWERLGLLNVATSYPHFQTIFMYFLVSLSRGDYQVYKALYYFFITAFWLGRNHYTYQVFKTLGHPHTLLFSVLLTLVFDWYSWGLIHHQLALFLIVTALYYTLQGKRYGPSVLLGVSTMMTLFAIPLVLTPVKLGRDNREKFFSLFLFGLTVLVICFPFMISNFPVFLSGYVWQFTRRPSMSIWGLVGGNDVWGEAPMFFVEEYGFTDLGENFNFLLPLSAILLVASYFLVKVEPSDKRQILVFNGWVMTLFLLFVKILESRYYLLLDGFLLCGIPEFIATSIASFVVDLMWRDSTWYYNFGWVFILSSFLIHLAFLCLLFKEMDEASMFRGREKQK